MNPFLERELIRKYTREALQEYEQVRGKRIVFPLDVADVFDRLFGLETVFDDQGIINQRLGDGIIGCLFPDGHPSPWGKDKLIIVNVTKSRSFNPICYNDNFTIAHEGVGHYILHFLKGITGEKRERPEYCRSQDHSPLEWQANFAAGELTQPFGQVIWLLDGKKPSAEQGHYPSFAPLGFQNNRETKRIEIDPEVAPLIRKPFEWYATGNYSLLQVRNMARKLMEAEGLAFQYAKRVTKSTVEHILKNPIYYGDFLWNGKLYHGSHAPIVSHGLWEQTQEAFRKTNHPKQTKREFPFIGMLTCAFCGCAITAEIKKGKYIYYHCTGNHGPCPRPAARQETLEEKLGEVIKGITIDEGLLDWLIQALGRATVMRRSIIDGMIANIQAQYDKLQHHIDQSYTDKLDGKIPEDLFLRKMNGEKSRAKSSAKCEPIRRPITTTWKRAFAY
jgi:hypothetical protein